jgi:hypothetical protein
LVEQKGVLAVAEVPILAVPSQSWKVWKTVRVSGVGVCLIEADFDEGNVSCCLLSLQPDLGDVFGLVVFHLIY